MQGTAINLTGVTPPPAQLTGVCGVGTRFVEQGRCLTAGGVFVSVPTLGRAAHAQDWTRKKGLCCRRAECDRTRGAALAGGSLAATPPGAGFMDESGFNQAMAPWYGSALKGERSHGVVPRYRGATLSYSRPWVTAGLVGTMTVEWATSTAVFLTSLDQVFCPALRPSYNREFKEKAAALVHGGCTISGVARDLGVTTWLLGRWVQFARIGGGQREPPNHSVARVSAGASAASVRCFNDVLWILRLGACWEDQSFHFSPHQTCRRCYQAWMRSGARPARSAGRGSG